MQPLLRYSYLNMGKNTKMICDSEKLGRHPNFKYLKNYWELEQRILHVFLINVEVPVEKIS